MKEEAWNRCDICGKFFGFKDLESGAARIWQITPDTEWTYERWGKLCAKHNTTRPEARP